MTTTKTQQQRSAQIRKYLDLGPQILPENSDRVEAIQILISDIEATGDLTALLGLSQQLTAIALKLTAR